MEEKKFRVGDRVRVIGNDRPHINYGETGTVRYVESLPDGTEGYAVEFDKRKNVYHDCGGECTNHHGWWVYDYDLELIPKKAKPVKFRVIIESDGECTSAKLLHGRDVVREAEVNRYYKDEHDEQTAIEAVVSKMFPLKTPEKAKEDTHHDIRLLVCVNTYKSSFAISHNLREGDVYAVIDGKLKRNGNTIYSGYAGVETLNLVTNCEFVEIYNSKKTGGICGG